MGGSIHPGQAIAELRGMLSAGGALDYARCQHLLVMAASRGTDLDRIAELVAHISTLLPAVEFAETLGSERQVEVNTVMDLLDELEGATKSN